MTPDEISEWCEIICEAFTEDEIEHLEIFAHKCFSLVENGVGFTMPDILILDTLLKYREEEGE